MLCGGDDWVCVWLWGVVGLWGVVVGGGWGGVGGVVAVAGRGGVFPAVYKKKLSQI